jgi:hypothetical protein
MIPCSVIGLDVFLTARRKCRSPSGTLRSGHSSLMDRTKRSACALASGARSGIRTTRMPLPEPMAYVPTPFPISIADQYLRRVRRTGSAIVSVRTICQMNNASGCVVDPRIRTRPDATSITSVRPFPSDQPAMPAQQGVRRRSWRSPAGPHDRVGALGRPATAIVVRETRPTSSKLTPQEPVLFDQVREGFPLPAVQPPGQHAQHPLLRRGVDHEAQLIPLAG